MKPQHAAIKMAIIEYIQKHGYPPTVREIAIVICEYRTWMEWKEKYTDENPDSLRTELHLLKPGYRYLNDCKSNESAIVEHLKHVQKQVREGQV